MAILKNIPHTARRMSVNILLGFLATFFLLSCASLANRQYNDGVESLTLGKGIPQSSQNTTKAKEKAQAFQRAIDNFSKAISSDRKHYEAYNNRGVARMLLVRSLDKVDAARLKSDLDKAIMDFKKAKKLAKEKNAEEKIMQSIEKNLSNAENLSNVKGGVKLSSLGGATDWIPIGRAILTLLEEICDFVMSWWE